MTEIGLVAAFAAGILALLSPCSALLLPSFFAYAFASRTGLLLRTLAFYVGLLITLVPLGMGASAASQLFYGHRPLLISIAGWSIIALGVMQLLGRSFAMPFAGRLQSIGSPAGNGKTSWLSTVLLGAVYGLAGFCSGPILGAILTMAATSDSPLTGGTLLAAYGFGMAAPLFVLAALWDRFELGSRGWLRGRQLQFGPLRLHTTSLASGLLFIAIGTIFLRYDGTAGITGLFGIGDTSGLEFSAQNAIAATVGAVPNWTVPAAVALIALGVAWRRSRRDSPHQDVDNHWPPRATSKRRAETGAAPRPPSR